MHFISEMKLKTGNALQSDQTTGGNGRERATVGCRRGGDRKVVVVGVKLERRSRELLTWSLMKIAQPGDLVIALHVILHSSSGEQSTLLSLVKTFDSVLSVYEGFCHLKQVDLKLKVCRGSSVRKTLTEQAKLYNGATVIVGTSKSHHHPILSLTCIAKHCARKLSHEFSVVAVDNGKIMFQRKATASDPGKYMDKHFSVPRSTILKRYFGCGPVSKWSSYPCGLPKVELCIDVSSYSVLGSVPYRIPKPSLKPKQSDTTSLAGRLSRLRLQNSAMRFDPNEKQVQPFAKYLSMCKLFKYKELLSATSGFLPEGMIGRGGSSYVFKGRLSDGKEVAVKTLKSSEEVLNEFIAEIDVVTSLSHKNIISLLGFCIDYETPILVYNLLPRGSLHGMLKDVSSFGWEERYKVAFGVAKALDHLHGGISKPVIHRDVKSSNILLAEDFEPQLADFGLATWASTANSPSTTCTDVAGTFGYLAPEYFMHGKVTEKIDVYAFGVVLLELLSGRKPIDNTNPVGRKNLVMWATPLLKAGKVSHLVDARLGSDHYVIERMALAATLCIRRATLFRPRISLVLKILQGDPQVTKWAKQQIKTCSLHILDGEASPEDIQSHLNTAFLDLEDDTSFTKRTERVRLLEI